jgi:biotin transport system substrate-specific component
VSLSSSAVPRPGRAVLADLVPGERVRDLVLVGGYAGLTGLAAQVAVPLPFTPVPVTGQTLAVLLGAAVLGWQRAFLGMGLYLAAGLVGVPWFSGWSGGTGVLSAPSFGYIVGFVVAAAVVGRLAAGGLDRTPVRVVVTMVVGNLVVYAFGLPWLMASVHVGVAKAIGLGVTPFLGGDGVKIALAAGLLPSAWSLVRRWKG